VIENKNGEIEKIKRKKEKKFDQFQLA